MLPTMLEQDHVGGLVGRASRVAARSELREYRELEAGARSPNWETFDRICKLYGWPQTFVGQDSGLGVE
jgi:hypothetical protein